MNDYDLKYVCKKELKAFSEPYTPYNDDYYGISICDIGDEITYENNEQNLVTENGLTWVDGGEVILPCEAWTKEKAG